jgi:hypothetical protein
MASCILHREWEHKLADTEYKFAGKSIWIQVLEKSRAFKHEHFAAMEPTLAHIKVKPSVSVSQVFNINCPPTSYLSPLHSSVVCLLCAQPTVHEYVAFCSQKSDRRENPDRTLYQGGAENLGQPNPMGQHNLISQECNQFLKVVYKLKNWKILERCHSSAIVFLLCIHC